MRLIICRKKNQAKENTLVFGFRDGNPEYAVDSAWTRFATLHRDDPSSKTGEYVHN